MREIYILLSLILFNYSLHAQNDSDPNYDDLGGANLNTITTAVPFLLISPDSRSGAMGDVLMQIHYIGIQQSIHLLIMRWVTLFLMCLG